MEWINMCGKLFHNMYGKKFEMGPHNKSASNTWFPGSGKNLLGKLTKYASTTCCQALTRNTPNQSSHSSHSLLRLNSQGESSNSEEDLSIFPSVEPTSGNKMDKSQEINIGCDPLQGLQNPEPSGFPVSWSHVPNYVNRCAYPVSGSYSHNMGHQSFLQQDFTSPKSIGFPQHRQYFAYNNHNGASKESINFRFNPNCCNDRIFQFRGHNTNGYRTPRQEEKCHKFYRRCGCEQDKGKQQGSVHQNPTSSPAKKNQQNQGCDSGQSWSIVNSVTSKLFKLDISSEQCDSHADVDISTSGTEPSVNTCSLESGLNKLATTTVHDLCHVASTNYINTELSLVTDLSCDLCDRNTPDDSVEWQKVHLKASNIQPAVPNTADKCDPEKLLDSKKPDIQTACNLLTPKTSCISRKKKGRPSSKKRHRRKLQQCAEDQIIDVSNQSKKQKTRPSCTTDVKIGCHESMSFVIDFSESDYSESELQCSGSPGTSTSPITAKFSLFIRAGDLSDEEITDSDEFSDSDFFDEENTQATTENSGAPVKETTKSFSPSTSSNWQSVFQDVGSLSPFTFQITCITNPRVTAPNEDLVDGVVPDIHDEDGIDPDSKKRLDNANNIWQLHYNEVSVNSTPCQTKVHFPLDDSHLQTVFTLKPEEVDAYREARVGKWEEFARDRQRFKDRIEETKKTIARCLMSNHREKMYSKLYE